ncbi:hypothetical protein ACIHDR_30155 [Nocardia sp. NPDC052278]|uniref:SbtR family transcriptional regulator n=1 Tax=unclassified Nocardia TaxID=2637762 RepID=UPI0036A7F483
MRRPITASAVPSWPDRSTLGFDCPQDIHQAGAALLTRAQQGGGMRSDVGIDDVVQLVAGIALAARHGTDPDQPDRLLRLVTDALRSPSEQRGNR